MQPYPTLSLNVLGPPSFSHIKLMYQLLFLITYIGAALGLLWGCSQAALGQLWDCSGAALRLLWGCSGDALSLL